MTFKIGIIGAGIAGLTFAQKILSSGIPISVSIFEKSRGYGGRISTRLSSVALDNGNIEVSYDHGAQFFTIRSEIFKNFIRPLIQQNKVQPWNARVLEINSVGEVINKDKWPGRDETEVEGNDKTKRYERYVGVPKMNSIAQDIVDIYGLKNMIFRNNKVTRMNQTKDSMWELYADDEYLGFYDWIITTIPADQAQDLLLSSDLNIKYVSQIESYSMLPCFTLMLTVRYGVKQEIDFDVIMIRDNSNSSIGLISRMLSKPSRKISGVENVLDNDEKVESFVVMMNNVVAKKYLENDTSLEDIKSTMLEDIVKLNLPGLQLNSSKTDLEVIETQIHRWKYARAEKPSPNSPTFLVDETARVATCGDWCVDGKVEAAFLSATSCAAYITEQLKNYGHSTHL